MDLSILEPSVLLREAFQVFQGAYIGYNYYSTSGNYYMQSFRVTNVAMYANEFVPHKTPHVEEINCLKRCEYKLQYKLVLQDRLTMVNW